MFTIVIVEDEPIELESLRQIISSVWKTLRSMKPQPVKKRFT